MLQIFLTQLPGIAKNQRLKLMHLDIGNKAPAAEVLSQRILQYFNPLVRIVDGQRLSK